nr:hypothetical protein [Micromonospora sp. 15K316]
MPPRPEPQRHPARLDPHRPHLPRRPLWRCRVCPDLDWPCPPARLLLAVEYRRNLAGLAVYMGQQLAAALEDLGRLDTGGPPDGNALYERFMTWIARKREVPLDRPRAVDPGAGRCGCAPPDPGPSRQPS